MGMYTFIVGASPDRRHIKKVSSVPRFMREARNGLITFVLIGLWIVVAIGC